MREVRAQGSTPALEFSEGADELTGLPRRGALQPLATRMIDHAVAEGTQAALFVVDVDYLKLVNDTYGHAQGDVVIRTVARLLQRELRAGSVALRYAGDEFVVLAPEMDARAAGQLADRLCASVRQHSFPRVDDSADFVAISLSIGVALAPRDGTTFDDVFSAADGALYAAKAHGRNGFSFASVETRLGAPDAATVERFVGRTSERRRLSEALNDTRSGAARIVALTGDAGVGKSTLLRQLVPEVRLRGGLIATGACVGSEGVAPFAPWIQVMRGLARQLAQEGRTAPPLPRIADDDPSLAAVACSRFVVMEEVATYLRTVCATTPLLLVLEDMHRGDSASWDLTEYLAAQAEELRLLICITLQSAELRGEPLRHKRRLSKSDAFSEIELTPLPREDVATWLERVLQRRDLSREMVSFVYHFSEGNPFFVEHLLRTMLEDGIIRRSSDRWEWRPVAEMRMPVAIQDLVARRLEGLSPPSRSPLRVAAVIGRTFALDVLLEACGGGESEAAVLDAIDEGIREGILRAHNAELEEYAFAHGLLVTTLTGELNTRRLRQLHLSVARSIAELHPDDVASIARHYDCAGDGEAFPAALSAAKRALAIHGYQESWDLLRIAERRARTPADQNAARVELVKVAEAAGRYAEAEQLCDLAIGYFTSTGDRRQLLTVLRKRERIRSILGQAATQSLRAVDQLLAEADALEAPLERAALLVLQSGACLQSGDVERARSSALEAVRLAEAGADTPLATDALNRVGVAAQLNDPALAKSCYERALALCSAAGDAIGEARARNNLAVLHILRGEWGDAQSQLLAAIERCAAAGAPDFMGALTLNLGSVYQRTGDYELAQQQYARALKLCNNVGNSERALFARYNLAHVERERGALVSAARQYEETAMLASRLGQADVAIGASAGLALTQLRLGDRTSAADLGATLRARVATVPEWFQGRELVSALDVLLAAPIDEPVWSRFEDACRLAASSDQGALAWLIRQGEPALRLADPMRFERLAGSLPQAPAAA